MSKVARLLTVALAIGVGGTVPAAACSYFNRKFDLPTDKFAFQGAMVGLKGPYVSEGWQGPAYAVEIEVVESLRLAEVGTRLLVVPLGVMPDCSEVPKIPSPDALKYSKFAPGDTLLVTRATVDSNLSEILVANPGDLQEKRDRRIPGAIGDDYEMLRTLLKLEMAESEVETARLLRDLEQYWQRSAAGRWGPVTLDSLVTEYLPGIDWRPQVVADRLARIYLAIPERPYDPRLRHFMEMVLDCTQTYDIHPISASVIRSPVEIVDGDRVYDVEIPASAVTFVGPGLEPLVITPDRVGREVAETLLVDYLGAEMCDGYAW